MLSYKNHWTKHKSKLDCQDSYVKPKFLLLFPPPCHQCQYQRHSKTNWTIVTIVCLGPIPTWGQVLESQISITRGKLLWDCLPKAPCGCQENRALVEPIRDGPFRSWYWLFTPQYGQHMGIFMRQLHKQGIKRCAFYLLF